MAKLTEAVSNAVTVLMTSDPFHAAMLVNMDLIETDDDKHTPTAKTDGYRKIWLNTAFMAKMTPQEGAFVLAHEIGHKVLQHGTRALSLLRKDGKLSPLAFNIAGDFHINKFLADAGYSMPSGPTLDFPTVKSFLAGEAPPAGGYMLDHHLPNNADTELLYAELVSVIPPEMQQQQQQAGSPQEPCDGGQGGQSGNSDPQDGQGDQQSKSPDKGGGLGESGSGAEDLDMDEFKKTMDEEGVTPEQAADQIKTDIVAAALSARDRGSVPGHVKGLIDEMNQPHKDWRAQLRRFMGGLARDDYSYRRPNRRSAGQRFIQPSLYSERPGTVAIIVDTSGSVADKELAQGLAEISSISKRVKPQRIVVISCDTKVNAVDDYRSGQSIKTLKTHGRGGTDMDPAFQYLKENSIRPDCIICFTDGELHYPPRADVCAPVMWAVCNPNNTGAHKVPYGRHIEIIVQE